MHSMSATADKRLGEAISVGAPFRAWWFVLAGAATAMLAAAGAVVTMRDPDAGMWLFAAAAVSAMVSTAIAISLKKRQGWVRITPDGFVSISRQGERSFDDDQIICASLYSKSNYSNGEFKSISRTFDVWMEAEDGPQRVVMVNTIRPGRVDPLQELITRLLNRLYERGNDILESGQPFEGEEWTLYPTELVARYRRHTTSLPLDELAAVDIFDQSVCVWRHDQDEPATRIPVKSANAHVLLRLLAERVAPQDENREPSAGAPGLGRVLFERRPGAGMRVAVGALPVLALLCSVGGVVWGAAIRDPGPIFGGCVIGVVTLLIWMIPLSQHVTFRCHERGLYRKWVWRETRLRYDDVSTFTYNAVRQFVKGVYSGTNFKLTFCYDSGGKSRKLTYAKTIRNADDELDNLRDRISSFMAGRMAELYAQRHTVTWTAGLRFLREGIEYRPSGLLGRKPPVMIPFESILGFDIQQGTFHLWTHGQTKPVIKENVGEPNFFPGYFLLTTLSTSPHGARDMAPSPR